MMLYCKISYWIIILYIILYIISRIFAYSAAILHNWCMLVLNDWQLWYDKGTTIKSLYDKISQGDNFCVLYQIRFIPIFNILAACVWLLFEILLFVFVVVIHLLRLILYILQFLKLNKCISKIICYIKKINSFIQEKFIQKITKIYNTIKTKILNIRIS